MWRRCVSRGAAQLKDAEKVHGSICPPDFRVLLQPHLEPRSLSREPGIGWWAEEANKRAWNVGRTARLAQRESRSGPASTQSPPGRAAAAGFCAARAPPADVPIREGEFLHLPGDEIEQVYFLHNGIVSLMTISKDGDAISTASVGSEGAIGTIAGTGFVRAFTRAMVQAPGAVSRIAVP